jgi:hypothetical protein
MVGSPAGDDDGDTTADSIKLSRTIAPVASDFVL